MQCPVPHNKDTKMPAGHPTAAAVASGNYKLSPPPSPRASSSSLSSASASGSSTPPDVAPPTPGFAPNAPASTVPSKNVTLEALLYESGAGDGIRPATVDEWPLPEDLDFSRPVSELLRKGTQRAHVAAEHSDGAVALTNGQLELQEYIRWLAVVWRVYDALEAGLRQHANHPVLAPTYNPTLLARAPELAKDITFLLKRLPASIAKPSKQPLKLAPEIPLPPFPLPPFLEEVFVYTPAALAVYMDRINELTADPILAPRLLAHAYVRYLGDLSGGQIIGARLRKAYGLPGLDGRRFYYFAMGGDASAAEAGEETVGERKKKLQDVKTWYRTGMDEGAGEDATLKATLVREANVAFVLNTHLFSLITPPPPAGDQTRYFEKLQEEQARRARLAGPPPTLVQKLTSVGYMLAAVFIAIFVLQALAPTLEPYAAPLYHAYIDPLLEHYVVPWYNTKFVPWWDSAAPVLQKALSAQSRALI